MRCSYKSLYAKLTTQIMEVILAERKEVILTTDGEDALDEDGDGPSDDARKKIQIYCKLLGRWC